MTGVDAALLHGVAAALSSPELFLRHLVLHELALLDAHRCRLYLSGPKERQHYQ